MRKEGVGCFDGSVSVINLSIVQGIPIIRIDFDMENLSRIMSVVHCEGTSQLSFEIS